ncbi:urease accessory protein UreE [Veronia nyctiphanis]|uniref:Urease accessory protein UreE n=1 Tax=Veronia nyctiphanis TaxID=1278244 RepID=A0A4Q0YSE5_9GAMM|nr:urease accessory protein UreE [Veronia nyctiphanis]RXJ74122.1 urease accessory protein UreE [Veronia nyctiphanis]
MKKLTHLVDSDLVTFDGRVSLTIDQRIKSRLKVVLASGEDAGIFLPRGRILRGGEALATDDGFTVEVVAADETVSTVTADSPLLMARLCYHLGNRHVPLEITETYLRYQHDHVLDEMVVLLGGQVLVEQAPFEPEAGAYGQQESGHHHHHHEHE